jgi:hypothetical protein
VIIWHQTTWGVLFDDLIDSRVLHNAPLNKSGIDINSLTEFFGLTLERRPDFAFTQVLKSDPVLLLLSTRLHV